MYISITKKTIEEIFKSKTNNLDEAKKWLG